MEQSPSETYDDNANTTQWDAVDHESPDSNNENSPTPENNGPEVSQKSAAPMQKRRRVTRACDECRRKKIKCDGKQPCTHCTVYSYECTYDQPSNRRRNAQPQYIEALEAELKRAKAVIGAILPNIPINLKDPDLEAKIHAGMLPRMPIQNSSPASTTNNAQSGSGESGADIGRLESMVKATGQLDLDEQGYYDYHGGSSGLSFIRRMREQLGDIIGPEGAATPFVKTRPMSMVFESPKSADSPLDSKEHLQSTDIVELPPQKDAIALCDNAVIDATSIMRFVHVPSFYKSLDRIYEVSHENYTHEDHTFLPLLYSVLALGTLFSRDDSELDKLGYEGAIDRGFKYFQASRKLLDIADCRDLPSIQAVLFMILFLQSSAKLSTCYSYIGVAIRSALRLGLHRSFSAPFHNCIEREVRKRVFWAIRKMDLYVGALIGLPYTLDDEDIDQEFPAEIDDEYITEDQILPYPPHQCSVMTAFNFHARLMIILGKIVRLIYPIKGTCSTENGMKGQNYAVSLATIHDLETQLQQWVDSLPNSLRPGGEAPQIILRCQHMLRLSLAHSQMMLYRPFLHYVSERYRTKDVDQRAYKCAVACVSVARNIVHIAVEMKKQHLLIGAYWSTMYTTYFSVMSLIFFILQNPEDQTSQYVLRDALEGKEVLAQLAKRSLAADRCSATLSSLFEQLPENLPKTRVSALSQKKRGYQARPQPYASASQPDLSVSADDSILPPRRAGTFPENFSNQSKPSNPYAAQHLAQQQMSLLGLDYQQSPHYSSNFESTPSMTPSSATSTAFGHHGSHQQQTSFPNTPLTSGFFSNSDVNGPPVTDMSAMMFPSPDPFAYPNQPMAALDNHMNHPFGIFGQPDEIKNITFPNAMGQPSMTDVKMSNTSNTQQMYTSPNVQDDVQLFGTMPMYMMQSSSSHTQPFAQNPNPHQLPGTPTRSSPLSANLAMDGPDFIGDEWAMPTMHQGGYTYGSADMAF